MRFTPALVAGALACCASAFLVPLEVAKAAEQASVELAAALNQGGVTIDLDCPGCPFAGDKDKDDQLVWQDDRENQIHLQVDADFERGLLINGQSALPSDPNHAGPKHLTASQIDTKTGKLSEPLRLAYILERLGPITTPQEQQKRITLVRFTITAVENVPVKVDTLEIALLETADSSMVAKVTNIPFDATPGAASCDPTSKWSLCRLRAILTAYIQRITSLGKAHAQAAKGWVKGGCRGGRGKFGKHGKHGKLGKHGHHAHGKGPHHHHRVHRFRAHRIGRMLHQTLRWFIIPALLGIIGGLMASAIGMLIGQLIVYCWIRFRRNGQRGNVRIVEIVVADDEKEALMDEEEEQFPPQYQDEEAVTVEEKH